MRVSNASKFRVHLWTLKSDMEHTFIVATDLNMILRKLAAAALDILNRPLIAMYNLFVT